MAPQEKDLATPFARHLFLVGAMKAGTTTLHDLLASHPQIAASARKEVEFFSYDHRWSKGMEGPEGYLAQWPDRTSQAAAGMMAFDASTGYTKSPRFPDAAQRMARLDAEVHIIYLLRNPMDRLRSGVRHDLGTQWGAKSRKAIRSGHVPPLQAAYSDYGAQMAPYEAWLPRNHIHLVRLDDLRADPAGVVRDLCRRIGLEAPWNPPLSLPVRNRADSRRVVRRGWQWLSGVIPATWGLRRVVWWSRRRSWAAPLFWGRWTPDYQPTAAQQRGLWDQWAPGLRRLGDAYGVPVDEWIPDAPDQATNQPSAPASTRNG